MPRPCAAFDGGGVEAVEVELVADFLEQAQFGFLQLAVGGADVAGQRVGGLEEPLGQVVADQPEKRVQPVLLLEEVEDDLRGGVHPVDVIIGEDRQHVDGGLDLDQFGGADVLVRGRDRDHQGHEAVLRGEHLGVGICHGDRSFSGTGVAAQNIDGGRAAQ